MTRRTLPDEVLVARHFDADGRLISMPVKDERRRLVLQHLVADVPTGVDLDEYTVNNLLRPFSPDVASLRRHLVVAGLLQRPSPGTYRREQPQPQPPEQPQQPEQPEPTA